VSVCVCVFIFGASCMFDHVWKVCACVCECLCWYLVHHSPLIMYGKCVCVCVCVCMCMCVGVDVRVRVRVRVRV